MLRGKFLTAAVAGCMLLVGCGAATAQEAKPDWASMPTVAPTGKPDDPMLSYYNSTIIGEYHPLWVYHLWFNRDGTHMIFYGHHYPDGTTHMGASQRYWRLVGTAGHYALCLRSSPDPKSKEDCSAYSIHHDGDVWYQDYDRLATGDIPTYNNVHEVFSFVAGRR